MDKSRYIKTLEKLHRKGMITKEQLEEKIKQVLNKNKQE